jgi:homoserine dehydrogenase
LNSATVGGSTTILEHLDLSTAPVTGLRGILNGTANFVLDHLATGTGLPQALDAARVRGFAERDASRDLSGLDAAEKLTVLANQLGHSLTPDVVACYSIIDEECAERAQRAAACGLALRQVADLDLCVDAGGVQGSVRLMELPPTDRLFDVQNERNACVVERESCSPLFLAGTGAGGWPTAQSILGDLLQIRRKRSQHHSRSAQPVGPEDSVRLRPSSNLADTTTALGAPRCTEHANLTGCRCRGPEAFPSSAW